MRAQPGMQKRKKSNPALKVASEYIHPGMKKFRIVAKSCLECLYDYPVLYRLQ
jgi:hypothetical protein